MCAPEPIPNIGLLILIICHLKCTYTTFMCNVSLKIVNTLRISVLISGFLNYTEYLKQSLFSKWRQTLPPIPNTRNKHIEQTKFLKFYVKCFVIPPLLNEPQFLSLESNSLKLCIEFFKKIL